MKLELRVTGDVVERQELLNGTQILTLAGESSDGVWSLVGDVAWNVGLVDFAGEGDITISRRDGAELFGTLTAAVVSEIGDSALDDADHRLRTEYEIDGGSGEFESVGGSAIADGVLAGGAFRVTLALSISGVDG